MTLNIHFYTIIVVMEFHRREAKQLCMLLFIRFINLYLKKSKFIYLSITF